jgi:hypothetical protein
MGEAIPHAPPSRNGASTVLAGASTVETVPHNPLKSFKSTVASTLPRRFDGSLQAFENVTSTVLDGPLSRNPHTPYSAKKARAIARPRGRSPPKSKRSSGGVRDGMRRRV